MSAVGGRVCIPEIGSRVRLEEDWNFALYADTRNESLIEILLGEKLDWSRHGALDIVTLPAGTELVCQRVYIRVGLQDFSSLTWTLKSTPDPRFYETRTIGKKNPQSVRKLKKGLRFWTKLADVNMSNMVIVNDKAADETQDE